MNVKTPPALVCMLEMTANPFKVYCSVPAPSLHVVDTECRFIPIINQHLGLAAIIHSSFRTHKQTRTEAH